MKSATLADQTERIHTKTSCDVSESNPDNETGLRQCVAWIEAAQIDNERSGHPLPAVYGRVTTGEDWLFSLLGGTEVTIVQGRCHIDNVGAILAALQATIPPADEQGITPAMPPA